MQELFIKKLGLFWETVLIITLMWNSSSFPSWSVPFIFYWVLKSTCSIHNSSATVGAVIVCPLQGHRKARQMTHLRNLASVSNSQCFLATWRVQCGGTLWSDCREYSRNITVLRLLSNCTVSHLWGLSPMTNVLWIHYTDTWPGQGRSIVFALFVHMSI